MTVAVRREVFHATHLFVDPRDAVCVDDIHHVEGRAASADAGTPSRRDRARVRAHAAFADELRSSSSADDDAPANNRGIKDGRRIFRYDTFGDEQLWTGVLRMHEVIATVPPATAMAVGLKVDVEALPGESSPRCRTGALI